MRSAFAIVLACACGAGCRVFVEAPEARLAATPIGWSAPDAAVAGAWINERFDWCRQSRGAAAAVLCGMWVRDPANTVEIGVHTLVDGECRVRVLVSDGGDAREVVGAYRITDGKGHWHPDRLFRPYPNGTVVELRDKAALCVTFPSVALFGRHPPEEGDRIDLVCEVEAGGTIESITGRFVVGDVRRDTHWGWIGR